MYMVGEKKKDINIIENGIEYIKSEYRMNRKQSGSSTCAKCTCQVKRKKDNTHD